MAEGGGGVGVGVGFGGGGGAPPVPFKARGPAAGAMLYYKDALGTHFFFGGGGAPAVLSLLALLV